MCNNKFFCFNRLFYFIIFKPNCSKLFTKVYFCFVLTSYFLWVICYEKKNIWTSIDFEVINFPFTRRDTNKQQLEIIALSFYTRIISGDKWRNNLVALISKQSFSRSFLAIHFKDKSGLFEVNIIQMYKIKYKFCNNHF